MSLDLRYADRGFGVGLERVLEEALGAPVERIGEPERLTGGASRETWAIVATTPAGSRDLILRRDPPGTDHSSLMLEAGAFCAARNAGVPTPEVLMAADSSGELGYPFILSERVPGETLARRILRDATFETARDTLATECGEILARIHSIDVSAIPGLERHDPLLRMRAMLDECSSPSPAFELAYTWLAEHQLPGGSDAVVHGDFRNGNLIVGPDGVRAVLDWEMVHIGNPIEDLGWLCVRCWRFGGPGRVGGFGAIEQLVAAYERAGGRRISSEEVDWWELWGTVHWGMGCLGMASWHLDGKRRSVELAAIGRRAWEQEYDAMLLLERIMTRR